MRADFIGGGSTSVMFPREILMIQARNQIAETLGMALTLYLILDDENRGNEMVLSGWYYYITKVVRV